MKATIFLTIALATLSILAPRPLSAKELIARISADSLNVRDKPNGNEVLAKLTKGTIVIISSISDNWGRLHFKDSKTQKYRTGWASMKHLQVIKAIGDDTYTTSRGAEFTISIDDANLDCREGWDGGYSACTVEISYSLSTNYNGLNDPNVNVDCEADLRWSDASGWPRSDSESDSNSHYMYSDSDSGSVELDFSIGIDPAVRVKISDYSCSISGVY